MSYFTDSPYERLMTQKSELVREAIVSPALPPNHPCYGCDYGRNGPCIGICYKKLMKRRSDKRRGS